MVLKKRAKKLKAKSSTISHAIQLAKESQIVEAQGASRRIGFFSNFVDGMNRLVRPIFSYGAIGYFVWAIVDPIGFTVSMQALAIVPAFMYGIFLTIVTFWFGGRILEKYADARLAAPSSAQLQEVLNNQRAILRQNDEQVATTVAISTPNPVVNDIVRGTYTMEPIYEEDEKKPS